MIQLTKLSGNEMLPLTSLVLVQQESSLQFQQLKNLEEITEMVCEEQKVVLVE